MNPGRNDPCPCGSGKKFKKCCYGNTDQSASTAENTEVMFAQLVNTAAQLRQQGRYDEALSLFNKAERLNPRSELLYFNRGMLYYSMGHTANMERDFKKARQLGTNHAVMFQKMIIPYVHLKQYEQAIETGHIAVQLDPSSAEAWLWLSRSYHDAGDDEKAYASLCDGIKHCTDHAGLVLAQALFLSRLPKDAEAIRQERTRFMENVKQLTHKPVTLDKPEIQLMYLPSQAAYHGVNDRQLREAFAELMLKCCPQLNSTAPHCQTGQRQKSGKTRLGIVSEVLHADTTSQFLDRFLTKIKDSGEFEIIIFTNSPRHQLNLQTIATYAHQCVPLGQDLVQNRSIISAARPDVLLYLEGALHHMSYFLSFARLAPVQCIWGGFPVTTGVPNADYFISAKEAEPPGYEEHYSEELLFLKGNAALFTSPEVDHKTYSTLSFGLPEGNGKTYLCPALLSKMHPDMDEIFARILTEDTQAHILLFESNLPRLQQAFDARLKAHIPPEHHARIHYLPFLPKDQFVHVLTRVDAVLDCLHFSFGTTAFLCFSQHVPFVTHRGQFLRSNGGGTYMYERIDLPDMVADSIDSYIEIARRLAHDTEFKSHMQAVLKERSHIFFEDNGISEEFMHTLKQLVVKHQHEAA